jgi:hypothetical protein
MKPFFLAGSIITTVIILIMAFGNLGASCNGFMFLFTTLDSPFFMVLLMSFIGIVTGVFYSGLVASILNSGKDEEEAPGNEW